MHATPVPEPAGVPPEVRFAGHAPLDLPRLVMRRAVLVVLLGMALLLWLGSLRMRHTVEDELNGARHVASLTVQLSQLQTLTDAQARQALQSWQAAGVLRHLQVRVLDDSGRVVLDEPPAMAPSGLLLAYEWLGVAPPAADFVLDWRLPRAGGADWQLRLRADPDSERLEALTSLLEVVVLLGGVGLAMLVVMAWNTRRAFAPLQRLLGAIGGLATGQVNSWQALPPMPIVELETIAEALRRLGTALVEAEQARRRLAAQVLSLQEDERARLARELHDEFGQQLTALRVNAAWLERLLADQPVPLAVVAQMAGQCATIQQDIRAVLARLRPLIGSEDDDPPTLSQLAGWLRELVSGWQRGPRHGPRWSAAIDLPADLQQALPSALALTVYRISQEALTNVARHADAREATLAVRLAPAGTHGAAACLHWSVTDDGIGGAALAEALQRGNGLAGLRERVFAQGGDLQIGPASADPERPGWRLSASFPVPALG